MALVEQTLYGVRDKVAIAHEMLRAYEPEEGYFLAFSGGKDSQCIYHLAQDADVKFDAHYHMTTVDPPELIYFIREHYPDVIFDRPKKTMWELILYHKSPPTRVRRYCCAHLKEHGGEGRRVITGVRWAESAGRRKYRGGIELQKAKSIKSTKQMSDNDESRRLVENCLQFNRIAVNPIVGWSDEEVWEYHRLKQLPHCSLYDEGFKRLGCIGCPMSTNAASEMERWPKFKAQYLRTFSRMIAARQAAGKCAKIDNRWTDAEAVMRWWLNEPDSEDGGLFDEDATDKEVSDGR